MTAPTFGPWRLDHIHRAAAHQWLRWSEVGRDALCLTDAETARGRSF